MKRKLVCFCEAEFRADIPDTVDLAKNKKAEEEILQGNFMTARCPACGKTIKPEFPVHLFDSGRKIDIFFIPELDRFPYYRHSLSYQIKDTKRVVIGYEELVEKLLVFKNKLDDRVIEMIKYYLLNKALRDSDSELELRIYFQAREGSSLVFHAAGVKEGRIGVLRVDAGMVEKVGSRLKEKEKQKPFSTILAGPYVSINKLFSEVEE